MKIILPWLVTLVALIVMVVVIVQRPMPVGPPHTADEPAEPPADPNDLAKTKQLIEKGGKWTPEEVAAFRDAYVRLPTKERVEIGQALARAGNSGKLEHPGVPILLPSGAKPASPCSPPTCPSSKEGAGPARGTPAPAMPKGTPGK